MQRNTSHQSQQFKALKHSSAQQSSRFDKQTVLQLLALFTFAAIVFLLPGEAAAGTGGTDLPWNTPLQNLLDNLTGSTARILAGLMLVVGGIVWGFTRNEEGAKRLGQAIVAIALMFGAVQIVDALAFAGGVI